MPKMGQVNRFIEGVWACPEAGEYKNTAGQFGADKIRDFDGRESK